MNLFSLQAIVILRPAHKHGWQHKVNFKRIEQRKTTDVFWWTFGLSTSGLGL
jgi:hypothetical protein